MLSVSDAYISLTESNVRPKCEPIITVSGVGLDGNNVEIVWTANEIQNLSYKRGVDPMGRELPFMELTWKEIYQGRLNEEQFPEKYNNVAQYMAVKLQFVQNLTMSNLSEKEIIEMPQMFLTARPVIENNTITWFAKDLLHFLQTTQIRGVNVNNTFGNSPTYFGVLGLMLLGERQAYLYSTDILNSIQKTVDALPEDTTDRYSINEIMIIDSTTKDFLLNFTKLRSYYMNFSNNIITFVQSHNNTDLSLLLNVMYEPPVIEFGNGVSIYKYNTHRWIESDDNEKIINPTKTEYLGVEFYRWDFGEYANVSEDVIDSVYADATYAVARVAEFPENTQISVKPLKEIKTENRYIESDTGEEFLEDNPLLINDVLWELNRFLSITKYFTKNNASMEIKALPNLAIETGDIISVETNLYKNNSNVIKKGVVTEISLEYNGALKETFKVHEVNV